MKTKAFIFYFLVAVIFGCKPNQKDQFGSNITKDPKEIEQGNASFEQLCSSCHSFKQRGIGPNLSGITRTVEKDWIKEFVRDPRKMADKKDSRTTKLIEDYKIFMPGFPNLTDIELNAIIGYLHTFEAPPLTDSDSSTSIKNPIIDTIGSSGILAELTLVTQVPVTKNGPPLARINKMECEKVSGRLFINDLRGYLYELKDDKALPYMSMRDVNDKFIDEPGLATGFGSFAFHPDFMNNGLLYTSHTEPSDSKLADFSYDGSVKVTVQWVVKEWKTNNPGSASFSGSGRELMRVNFVGGIHGMQEISFNPTIKKGNPDYGKLYIGLGDGGSVENGFSEIADHGGASVWSSILRIDPLGRNSENGQYGIPNDNPFVGIPNKRQELWAYGFRNPNRLVWDDLGELWATDIGQANIEELNKVVPGMFYGWPIREGTFLIDPKGDLAKAYPLPPNDEEYAVNYPFLQYDHDEGSAIIGGYFVKHGMFKGKYVFGDIVTGRLFVSNLFEAGPPKIEEWNIRYENKEVNLRDLVGGSRVDLRFGKDCNNNMYIFTKADGKIYKIKDW
tara:strand:- start:336 stop:2018 length:1683 start_codon:yes stop_codon:yes gene_type:complete